MTYYLPKYLVFLWNHPVYISTLVHFGCVCCRSLREPFDVTTRILLSRVCAVSIAVAFHGFTEIQLELPYTLIKPPVP